MNRELIVSCTHPQSRGRVARWMLEEVGVGYVTEYVEYGPAGMKAPAYRAIMLQREAAMRASCIDDEEAARRGAPGHA